MTIKHAPLTAIVCALAAANASAAGFGEIILHSRIGESLQAEVPLIGDNREANNSACFSLAAVRDSDLPVVTSAHIKLVRDGAQSKLVISGTRPIADPIFVVALRANCGVELHRDYVLMPSPPLSLAVRNDVGMTPPASELPRRPTPGRNWESQGESLENLAEMLVPDNPARQRRMLAALQRANPDFDPQQPLPEGTPVHIPVLRRPAPPPADTANRPSRPAQAKPRPLPPSQGEPMPEEPRPVTAAAPLPAKGDRLVLGAPPAEIRPDERAGPPKGSMADVEQRILKMETTIGLLNEQVSKLNEALTLATESLVIQQKLQMAQSLQTQPTAAPTPAAAPPAATQPPPPPPRKEDSSSWLEMLLSALVGGGIASYTAHVLSRRRQEKTLAEMTANFAPSAAMPAPHQADSNAERLSSAPSVDTTPTAAVPSASVDIDLGEERTTDVSVEERDSALHLAEIMLSYGRVDGAVEILADYIEEHSPDRIEPWLTLLNLYRRGNMRSEFERLMARMRSRFNFQIPNWEQSQTPISGLLSLEDYDHITRRLLTTWGTQDAMNYLTGLIHDNRHGQRAGFPLEVVEEIILLTRILEDAYACRRPV